MTKGTLRNLRNGLLFISPWILGFCTFLLYPLLDSLYHSFCNYSGLSPGVWVGFQNYTTLLQDSVFLHSVWNTAYLAGVLLPLTSILAFFLAMLLATNVRGVGVYRTLLFLPSLVPLVALGLLWRWIFNAQYGILNVGINGVLEGGGALMGLPPDAILRAPSWLQDPLWSKPAIVIASLWGCGHAMVIYLAGLNEVPAQLYESAAIDGAGLYRKTWHVTLPTISPVIYFNGIMGIIWNLQAFALPFVISMTGPGAGSGGASGGPVRSTTMYAMYLYDQAFRYFEMGYASAMAWILFVITVALTLLATRLSRRHVHYADS